jgi:hypothetical protein
MDDDKHSTDPTEADYAEARKASYDAGLTGHAIAAGLLLVAREIRALRVDCRPGVRMTVRSCAERSQA